MHLFYLFVYRCAGAMYGWFAFVNQLLPLILKESMATVSPSINSQSFKRHTNLRKTSLKALEAFQTSHGSGSLPVPGVQKRNHDSGKGITTHQVTNLACSYCSSGANILNQLLTFPEMQLG